MVAQTGSSFQSQSVLANRRLELADLVPLGAPVSRLKVQHQRQRRVYQNVVTTANPGQVEAEGIGEAEQVVETNVEIAAFDPCPGLARIHDPT
jgi:hypothetical protein